MGLIIEWYRMSVWNLENVLEIDKGEFASLTQHRGYNQYHQTVRFEKKMVKMANFMLYIFYHNFFLKS